MKFESQEMQLSFWTTEKAKRVKLSHLLALERGFASAKCHNTDSEREKPNQTFKIQLLNYQA